MIKDNEIKPKDTDGSSIALPDKYKRLSRGGGEVGIEKVADYEAYIFYTFRGVLDNYSGFVYDCDMTASQELNSKYFEAVQMGDSWYFCVSK